MVGFFEEVRSFVRNRAARNETDGGVPPGARTKGQAVTPAIATPCDLELVECLIGTVMPARVEKTELARVILARFGSFAGFVSAPAREIQTISGLGEHMISATQILNEAAIRVAKSHLLERDIFSNKQKVLDYLHTVLSREPIEQFRILFLDTQRSLIADEPQARGTVNHTPVYPREVARRALELAASSIILVHNHPSGDPTPSDADVSMTRQIIAACDAIGIRVADHIIVGNGRWVSFTDLGLIKSDL